MAGLPEVMGRKAVEEAIQAAKGLPGDKQAVTTPALVTKENASQFLQKRRRRNARCGSLPPVGLPD